MRFVASPDSGVLGFRHEHIPFLPRHRSETGAFLPANLGENGLGELASAVRREALARIPVAAGLGTFGAFGALGALAAAGVVCLVSPFTRRTFFVF